MDTRGAVRDLLEDPRTGEVRLRGFKGFGVEIPRDPAPTFYHRFPWGMTLFSAIASLLLMPWKRETPAG